MKNKINLKELFLFYLTAVLVSAPFRLNLINLNELLPLPAGLGIFYHTLYATGPLTGFIVVYYLMHSKVPRKVTFWGLNRTMSLLAILVIPAGLTISGITGKSGLESHYAGFLTGIMLVMYALAEEYGWRGYLQEALAPLPLVFRVLAIATLWYIWHLNFLRPGVNVTMHLIHFGSLVLGSWGLLRISESTGSLLFAAAVHL